MEHFFLNPDFLLFSWIYGIWYIGVSLCIFHYGVPKIRDNGNKWYASGLWGIGVGTGLLGLIQIFKISGFSNVVLFIQLILHPIILVSLTTILFKSRKH